MNFYEISTKIFQFTFTIFFFWGITGCTSLIKLGLASPQVTQISEIHNLAQTTQPIKVEGIVKKIVPLLDRKGFEIKDETGSIWVVTQGTIPKVGDRISLEAILKSQDIIIGGEKTKEFYLLYQDIEEVSTDSMPEDN
ncbi:hypothetical protein GM3708_3394 [Geminocystis sp. NIES-3708]|uniref:hypothetical protein n=1 Tax=Geminocystis sp. NIES-3708 TaxID=1615909 RepID=UPI0005FCB945|nr:hypothetical protein [Geminocystis sp. NIES-3708]BAQ62988.1 hypothetical protein GM3708_3394 [Geminocystis sp. NIES-3708]